MKKLTSKALIIGAGILASAGAFAASLPYEGVQCAPVGTNIGMTDPTTGNVAVSPVKVLFSPSNVSITPTSTGTSASISIIGGFNTSGASNTLTCSQSGAVGQDYAVIYLNGIGKNITSVAYQVPSPSVDASNTANAGVTPVVNGSASLMVNISNAVSATSSATDIINLTFNADTTQVALPQTISASVYLFNPMASGNKPLIAKMSNFVTMSTNDVYAIYPVVYVPDTNAVSAAYITLSEPKSAFQSGSNVEVYMLNTNLGGQSIVDCGNASALAINTGSTQLNQMVLDLSKLPALCGATGINLTPTTYQGGVSLLLDIKGVSNPDSIQTDGYSVFGIGDYSYIKHFGATLIGGNN